MKATLQELELHNAVLAGSNIASSKVFDTLSPKIINILKVKFQAAASRDETYILEAVNEALWSYLKKPENYNPEKSGLSAFLYWAARRDLQNILEKEMRHLTQKKSSENVELEKTDRNIYAKADDSADDTIQIDEAMTAVQTLLERFFQKEDIAVAWMILAGDKETGLYARELGLDFLPVEKQKEEVKKIKDRIKQVLKRNQIEKRIKTLLR